MMITESETGWLEALEYAVTTLQEAGVALYEQRRE